MRLLTGAAAGLTGLAVFAWLIVWSGVYSVAASRGHFAAVEWFLAFAMRQSVRTHSFGIKAPILEDDALVRIGAMHFDRGCADCHGTPGVPIGPIAQRMLPPPSDLVTAAPQWSDGELFWIIRNGIKYTGMPGWPALERTDEVWAMVAFLRLLPSLDRDGYRAVARESVAGVARIAEPCAACHGAGDEPPRSSLVPVLHAQPAKFLATALHDFAAGRRRSGIMQPAAAALSREEIDAVAGYYAELPPPVPKGSVAEDASARRGRRLAVAGFPERDIPPCLSCHGEQALPEFPRLAGQQARYIAGRLQRWQQEREATSPGAALMAPLARRLDARDIEDVARFFASLTPVAQRSGR